MEDAPDGRRNTGLARQSTLEEMQKLDLSVSRNTRNSERTTRFGDDVDVEGSSAENSMSRTSALRSQAPAASTAPAGAASTVSRMSSYKSAMESKLRKALDGSMLHSHEKDAEMHRICYMKMMETLEQFVLESIKENLRKQASEILEGRRDRRGSAAARRHGAPETWRSWRDSKVHAASEILEGATLPCAGTAGVAKSLDVSKILKLIDEGAMKPSFHVQGAGEEAVNGQWRQSGSKNGRQRFVRITDEDASITWDETAKVWQMSVMEDFGRSHRVLYALPDPEEQLDVPLGEGWSPVEEAAGPAPALVASERYDFLDFFDQAWAQDRPKFFGHHWATDADVDFDLSAEVDVGSGMLKSMRGQFSRPVTGGQKLKTGRTSLEAEELLAGSPASQGRSPRTSGHGPRISSASHRRSRQPPPRPTEKHWARLQGPYHETLVMLLWGVSCHSDVPWLFKSLVMSVVDRYPGLALVAADRKPHTGETILHAACAGGDVEVVRFVLEHRRLKKCSGYSDLLEGTITGNFLTDVMKFPEQLHSMVEDATPSDSDPDRNGATPLQVAIVAPRDDAACVEIVGLLIRHGAQVIYRDSKTMEERFTVLHLLARSAWHKGYGVSRHVTRERTQALLHLFLDKGSMVHYLLDYDVKSMKNQRSFTPLQVAAMFGNKQCFVGIMERLMVTVSSWGHVREVGFPLAELDSMDLEDELAALDLMTLHRRYNLFGLGLISAILEAKWQRFGRLWCHRLVILQLVAFTGTAMVCLNDSDGYVAYRYFARHAVIAISAGFTTFMVLIFLLCARDERLFKNMRFDFSSEGKVNFWELVQVRNVIELLLMGILVISPPWYRRDWKKYQEYEILWYIMASTWFGMFVAFSLRYLELFRTTRVLANVLPAVTKRDLVPFFLVFNVIWVCTSVALRISTSTELSDHNPNDPLGSTKRVFYTLEEAVHGPDAQWRHVVEEHEHYGGMIFVIFLWVALMMMTVIIAMFEATWTDVQLHIEERFNFQRATFMLTLEKLFPQWYYSHAAWGKDGCRIGAHLGIRGIQGQVEDSDNDEDDVFNDEDLEGGTSERTSLLSDQDSTQGSPTSSAPTITRGARRLSRQFSAGEKGLSMGHIASSDRWFLWKRGKDFDSWKHSVPHRVENKKL